MGELTKRLGGYCWRNASERKRKGKGGGCVSDNVVELDSQRISPNS